MVESKDAMQYALRLLGYRQRSVHEMSYRLKEKDYPVEAVDDVIARLKDWGYLNDLRFAEDWIQYRLATKPMGPLLLEVELKDKGIAKDIIDAKLAEAFSQVSEFELACNLAKSKYKGESDWKKVAGMLHRRGFSFSVIDSVKVFLGVGFD